MHTENDATAQSVDVSNPFTQREIHVRASESTSDIDRDSTRVFSLMNEHFGWRTMAIKSE